MMAQRLSLLLTALVVLIAIAAASKEPNCGFKPVLSSRVNVGPRRIWLSLFNGVGQDNPTCALGESGMLMTSLIVAETGAKCMRSDLLGIYGLGYYRLELSPDGKVIKRFNVGCSDAECTSCEYVRTQLSMGYCMSTPSSSGHVFSVAFAPADPETCVGPYHVTNMSGVTVIGELASDSSLCSDSDNDANCTAMVFALTVTDNDQHTCHQSRVFPKSNPFSYTLTASTVGDNESYTMSFCNGTSCTPGDGITCSDVFSSTPINHCVLGEYEDMPAATVLRSNSEIQACHNKKNPFHSWIALAAGCGAVVAIIGAVGIAKMYRRRQHRDYSPLN
eukprot:m.55878 g.55878  ORF g.55878 m.55878 type:complete len:333 (+) comp13667_c1_seq1:175-1173(+)